MVPVGVSVKRERADARRNRARILESAREVFASQGLACQIDDIARRACVGTGTIYRNFPTKQALLEAIVVDGVQSQAERARGLAGAEDPTEAFFAFLADVIERSRANKSFAEMLAASGVDLHAAKAQATRELHDAVGHLLRRAQAAGGVRSDVQMSDLMALLAGTCSAAAHHDGDCAWLSRVVCDGLRSRV